MEDREEERRKAQQKNHDAKDEPTERTEIIGEGSTKSPPGTWEIGNKGPLTPERAAEGDLDRSDAV